MAVTMSVTDEVLRQTYELCDQLRTSGLWIDFAWRTTCGGFAQDLCKLRREDFMESAPSPKSVGRERSLPSADESTTISTLPASELLP